MPGIGLGIGLGFSKAKNWAAYWAARLDTWHRGIIDIEADDIIYQFATPLMLLAAMPLGAHLITLVMSTRASSIVVDLPVPASPST